MSAMVFELDDLCDEYDPYDELVRLRQDYPNLRVTLFAIPGRCSPELLARYKALDWVELGVHGYYHSSCECIVWGFDEACEKLSELEALGWTKLFKAPGWQINEEVYKAIHFMGWAIADHATFAWTSKDLPILRYTYNLPGNGVQSYHGHTWETNNNGPSKWSLPNDVKFEFVSSVLKKVTWGDVIDDVQLKSNADQGHRHSNNILHTRINEFFEKHDPGTFADFGGWAGEAILRSKHGDMGTLIEGDPKASSLANSHGVNSVCANLLSIPIPDKTFDWGFCSHVLEHVEDVQKAWSEIKRCCKKGVYVVVPTETKEEAEKNPAHVHCADADGWANLLGIEIIENLPGKEVVGMWYR